jgi:hypothetical protein
MDGAVLVVAAKADESMASAEEPADIEKKSKTVPVGFRVFDYRSRAYKLEVTNCDLKFAQGARRAAL